MKRYQVHPQVGKGLRTFEPATSIKGGAISACYEKGYDTRGYRPYVMEIYESLIGRADGHNEE